MRKINIKDICKKHATTYSDGSASVCLEGFAEACFDQNTKEELIEALQQRAADKTSCANWEITPTEWRTGLEKALAARVISDNDDQIPE